MTRLIVAGLVLVFFGLCLLAGRWLRQRRLKGVGKPDAVDQSDYGALQAFDAWPDADRLAEMKAALSGKAIVGVPPGVSALEFYDLNAPGASLYPVFHDLPDDWDGEGAAEEPRNPLPHLRERGAL